MPGQDRADEKQQTEPEVFLSYARADRARAVSIVQNLTDKGYKVWWDHELLPGVRFQDLIDTKLGSCSCVVVLWSFISVKSKWVYAEAWEGLQRDILVPVTLDPDPGLPLIFRAVHTSHVPNVTDLDADPEWQQVCERIRELSSLQGKAAPESAGGTAPTTTPRASAEKQEPEDKVALRRLAYMVAGPVILLAVLLVLGLTLFSR